MLRITLDRATIELLHDLGEPLEFLDETGWLLGTFAPHEAERVEVAVPAERSHHREVEEGLGEEMCVFGYEMDLE
jgi:hypothetical protein